MDQSVFETHLYYALKVASGAYIPGSDVREFMELCANRGLILETVHGVYRREDGCPGSVHKLLCLQLPVQDELSRADSELPRRALTWFVDLIADANTPIAELLFNIFVVDKASDLPN